jgi:putative transposase
MRTSRFTDEQIIEIVREYEAGAKLAELCRKHGCPDSLRRSERLPKLATKHA